MTSINKILLLVFLSIGSTVMGFSQTHDDLFDEDVDTLIYTTPKQLENSVTDVATAILKNKYAKELQKKNSLSKENVRLLKYQMLLSALGMNGHRGNAGNARSLNDGDYDIVMSRLDNIETICYLLLQEKGISLPSRPLNIYRDRRGDAKNPIVVSPTKGGRVVYKQDLAESSSTQRDSILDSFDKRIDNVLNMLEMLKSENQQLRDQLSNANMDKNITIEIPNNKVDTVEVVDVVEKVVVDTVSVDNPVIDGYKRQVFFVLGGNILTDEAKATLDGVANMMKKHKDVSFDIIGYASSEGSKKLNLKLSGKRADVVFKYLVDKGISADRLFVQNGGVDKSRSIKATARRTDIILHK